MKRAVFAGSFDPFTVGHLSIVKRALNIFDEIYVAIGVNEGKKSFFPLKMREKWIQDIFDGNSHVKIDIFSSLTVEFAKKVGADFLLRGLRTSPDFEFERQIGQVNKTIGNGIETVFFLTLPEHTYISSTIVREIAYYKGDVSEFVPKLIAKDIHAMYKNSAKTNKL